MKYILQLIVRAEAYSVNVQSIYSVLYGLSRQHDHRIAAEYGFGFYCFDFVVFHVFLRPEVRRTLSPVRQTAVHASRLLGRFQIVFSSRHAQA